jgi:hypothetical protein
MTPLALGQEVSMKLMMAVVSLALASLVFSMALIGGRDPRRPRWASDGMLANVYVPIVICFGLLGVSSFISMLWNLGTQRPALWEIVLSAGIALAAVLGIKALKIGRRLERFKQQEEAAQTQGAQVIRIVPETPRPETPPKGSGRVAA